MSSTGTSTGTTLALKYYDSNGNLQNLPVPIPTYAASRPPFPIRFLKGIPVFWDDFESGPAGFVMPERALASQTTNTGPTTISAGRWNFRDGNEYGVYITANAASSGRRSLFTGGNPTTQTYGDIGNQDVSCTLSLPSGILGVEFDLLMQAGSDPGGHLFTVEDKDPTDSTKYRELGFQINPFSANGAGFAFCSLAGPPTVLSNSISDSNGAILTGLTGPFKGAGTSLSRGTTGSWHRVGMVVDMNLGKYIAIFLDKFYLSTPTLTTRLSPNTSLWKISSPDSTVNSLKEGLKRCEFHSLTNGTSFAPLMYHDNIVITDETGTTYT